MLPFANQVPSEANPEQFEATLMVYGIPIDGSIIPKEAALEVLADANTGDCKTELHYGLNKYQLIGAYLQEQDETKGNLVGVFKRM